MKRREKRKRNRKGNNGVPSYDKHPRTHQEKKRKVPSMTEAPRDTQARIKGEDERERERDREREREREREMEKKKRLRSKRPGTHEGEGCT